jgi:aromatic-L-amino-acid decarboxylase
VDANASNELWEWPPERIREFGYRVVDLIAEHLGGLREGPVFQPFPPELAGRYDEFAAPPESGRSLDQILGIFQSEIAPYPFGNGHPRFYGWVNSPPAVIGAFAEALAAAMNPSCAGGNHAAIYVERQVIRWFQHLMGFPPESMGLLVSGGSMAALTALAVARHTKCGFDVRAQGVAGAPARLLVYKSAEGHACYQKAVELLGIGAENLRTVDQDDDGRIRPDLLDARIREDRGRGHRPLCLVASAGAVNTGVIDPIDELANVCAAHGVWLHVDGAYGAPAILTEQYAPRLAALARANSLALDPHKWLYIPVEAGLVLVRDREAMRSAFSLVPPYLRTDGRREGVGGPPWLSEYGFQQTRGFRALKVWMALRYYGIAGYRASIERDIRHAAQMAALLRADPAFEMCEPQILSIVCFRHVSAALRGDEKAIEALNQRILERIQLSGRAFLSSTVFRGKFWLRACIVNPRATDEDIRAVVDAARDVSRVVTSPE